MLSNISKVVLASIELSPSGVDPDECSSKST
nr:MAG TPA: hypothetical protein [Caudoviricetes sp.]